MTATTEHLRPAAGDPLSTDDFSRTCGLSREEVRELIDYGLLSPGRLDLATALSLREAARLKKDFDLDIFSTGLLAGCMEQIHELRAEVRRLQAERPARAVVTEVSFTAVELRQPTSR